MILMTRYFVFLLLTMILISCNETDEKNTLDNNSAQDNFEITHEDVYNRLLDLNIEERISNISNESIRLVVLQGLGSMYKIYGLRWFDDRAVFYVKSGNSKKFESTGIQLRRYEKNWDSLVYAIKKHKFFNQPTIKDSTSVDDAAEIWLLEAKLENKTHIIIRSHEEIMNEYELFQDVFFLLPEKHDWRVPWENSNE